MKEVVVTESFRSLTTNKFQKIIMNQSEKTKYVIFENKQLTGYKFQNFFILKLLKDEFRL